MMPTPAQKEPGLLNLQGEVVVVALEGGDAIGEHLDEVGRHRLG